MEEKNGYYASREENALAIAQPEKDLENGIDDVADQLSPRATSMSSLSWFVLCSSMLLVEVQAALDSTITADLQPTIIDTFGEISKFPWINVTYSLGLAGLCLLW